MASALLRIAIALAVTSVVNSQTAASIPDYVLTYAPLIYLDVNEQYYPSDIAAQVTNTYPALDFARISNTPSNLSLSDLSSLNSLGGCSSFGDCKVYLTSDDMVTSRPPSPEWLYGVLPNPQTGETEGATSAVVIVHDHGNGTLDAYYMYFYAFNQGIPIGGPNGTVFGNHVGDWEHNMIRFENGSPTAMWYSQHANGEAYTWDAVLKNGSRPLGFSSRGGHATYAQEGTHVMYAGIANDSTSRGPLWDPVAGSGAWFYTFTPESEDSSNGTFSAVNVDGRTARGTGPTDFFYFLGKWGDKQYNSSYPGQVFVGSLTAVYVDGPTGPLDKELNRAQVCPGDGDCSTRTTVDPVTGTAPTQTVSRTYTGSPTTTGSGSTDPASTSTRPNAAAQDHAGPSVCLFALAVAIGALTEVF